MANNTRPAQMLPVNRNALTESAQLIDFSKRSVGTSPGTVIPRMGSRSTGFEFSKYTYGMPFHADPIEYRAQHQSAGNQLAHGFGRLITTTGTKLLEGIGYTVYSLPALISGDADIMFENTLSTFMGSMEDDFKEAMPIHHSRKYLNGNIWQQATTLGFYMDDVVDGWAFMTSALIGSKGLSAIGKGMNLYGKLGKAFSKAAKGAKLGKANVFSETKALKIATQEIELGALTLESAVREAGFEGKDTKDDVMANLMPLIKKGEMSYEEANLRASKAARNAFISNVFALLPSNYIQTSAFFKTFRGVKGNLAKAKALKEAGKIEDFSRLTRGDIFRTVGKEVGKNILSEGFWEENIQLAIQNVEKKLAVDGHLQRDRLFSLAEEWVGNYFTDEGQKAIALGVIISLFPGAVGGVRALKAEKEGIGKVSQLLDFPMTRYTDATKHLYKRKVNVDKEGNAKEYNRDLELDENGIPIPDYDKVAGEFVRAFQSTQSVLGLIEAAESNNQVMFDYLRDQTFVSWAQEYLVEEDGLSFAKDEVDIFVQQELQALQEAGESVQTQEEVQQLTDQYKQKLNQLQRVWDNIGTVTDGMTIGKTKESLQYRELLKLAQFKESTKQIFFEEKRRELQREHDELESGPESNLPQTKKRVTELNKQLDQIIAVIADSQERLATLFNEKQQRQDFVEHQKNVAIRLEEAKKQAVKDAAARKEREEREAERLERQDIEVGEKYKTKDPDTGKDKVVEVIEADLEAGVLKAQEIDENGDFVGEPFDLSVEELTRLRSVTPLEPDEGAEPIDKSDLSGVDRVPAESAELGVSHVYSALSNIHVEKVEGKLRFIIRNEKLNEHVSDPLNKMTDATVTFSIDFNTQTKEFWDQLTDEQKAKLKRTDLTKKEVSELLKLVNKNKFVGNLLDEIPIGSTIKDGDLTFHDGIYLHRSDFNYIRVPREIPVKEAANYIVNEQKKTRETRLRILEAILTGLLVRVGVILIRNTELKIM